MRLSHFQGNSYQTVFSLGVLALSVIGVEAQREDPGRGPEKDDSSFTNPNKECEPYYFEPIASALSSFPGIWQAATILPDDINAQAKWASIRDSVPDIPPKGTLQGNVDGLNYSSDDPDCWWTNTKCTTPKASGIPPDVVMMPEPYTLGYGFDDGPNCSHNAFYDFLAKEKQKATMFYIGSNVMDWPLETRRGVADGHEICIHAWSHQYMTAFSSEDAFAELYYSASSFINLQAVKLAAGVTPTCWRPPFGDVDDRIRAIASGLGLRTVLWEYDSQDWQVGVTPGVTSDDVDKEYQNMINDAKKGKFATVGTMILAHELDEYTMSEAMKFYPILKESFQHIVPVCVGQNITQPYVENDIIMPNFAQYIAGMGTNLIKNSTNITSTPGAGASPTLARNPVSSSAATGLINDNAVKKSGAALRVAHWSYGLGEIKMVLALLLAVAMLGLLPH